MKKVYVVSVGNSEWFEVVLVTKDDIKAKKKQLEMYEKYGVFITVKIDEMEVE